MNRSTALLVMAIALGVYGLYAAYVVLPMLVGGFAPGLLFGFLLQTICALGAAVGVWRGRRWAASALMLLGCSIAATWLYEGFVLGIVAYLSSLLVAAIALAITFFSAAYVSRT